MNDLQKRMYKDLLALTQAERNTFVAIDSTIDDAKFRIFTYRLISSYSQWLTNDSALECRGITFEMNDNDQPTRVVSWPFEKFFNLNENPSTTDLDVSNPTEILVKEDGSLISSMYLTDRGLYLKSKGSLQSEQAVAANELIQKPEWHALYKWTLDWAQRDYTVILEYTSPFNRIVVPYDEASLTVLAIRNNADGSYVDIFNIDLAPEIDKLVVQNLATNVDDPLTFLRNTPSMKGLEGYVVRLASGQRVKVKTEWYSTLHKNNHYTDLSEAGLSKAVLDDVIDDIRSMYAHSPEILKRIDATTLKVSAIYNETVQATTDFYKTNGELSRRDFAILAKTQLTTIQFGLAMKMYSGRPVDFAESVFRCLRKEY